MCNKTKVNTSSGDVSSPTSKKAGPRRYWYRPEVGPQPPVILISTNIGLSLGDSIDYVRLKDPDGRIYECGIEPMLRMIDLVQEPDRTKLLASAEHHYGLPLGAMMGPEREPLLESGHV